MSSQPQWSLDPTRNEYYYFDPVENVYVYQSGQKVPVPQQPASPISPRLSSPAFRGTPPPPPPKPSARNSIIGTPQGGPPRPPLPPSASQHGNQAGEAPVPPEVAISHLPPPEAGWLPEIVKDKPTPELHNILTSPSLQHSLVHNPSTSHPSLLSSSTHLQSLLTSNITLATQLTHLESQLLSTRQRTQTRLLTVRAIKSQFDGKQSAQDAALKDFSPRGLFQRLAVAGGEQEQLCRGLEESFLDEGQGGIASEREVSEFVRRVREARRVAYLRRERKERWDEGRIGGLRG